MVLLLCAFCCAAFLAFSSASCCLACTSPVWLRSDARRESSEDSESSLPRLASAIVVLMCWRTLSSAFTSASTERPSSCSCTLMRACADCILASIESRSLCNFLISDCTLRSEVLAESASERAVSISVLRSATSAASWFFFWMRMTARSSWPVETAVSSSASVCVSSAEARLKRSSSSSRRRMMAAVAVFSFEYFATIELIAFSYAISGCSFSMSEIQSDRKPRQRLARRLNMASVILSSTCRGVGRGGRVVELRRLLHHLRHLRLPEEFQDLLHLKLLVVADLDHGLQLRDALLHDVANVLDLRLVLLDARVRLLHQR